MSFKNVYRIALIAGVVLALVGSLLPSLAAAEKITIKAVSAWPKTTYETENFLKLLEIVKAKVDAEAPGQLEIQFLGGPEVISNMEQVEAARKGLVDLVSTTAGYYVSVVPEADAMTLTRIRSWEERAKGVNDIMNKIHQAKINCFYLGRIGTDIPFTVYLTKPVDKADFDGMSIRCAPTHVAALKKLNAKPVVIPPTEVYTALERGVCQGLVWPAGLIRDWGWDKVVKFTVDPGFYQGAMIILMNLDKWNKLPPNLQKILLDSQDQAEHLAAERATKATKDAAEAMAKEGMKTIKLPDAEAKKLVDTAYSTLWEVVIGKSPEYGPKLRELVSQ
jgi:TRAP-type C4-dicarboxylate transport system substrate-binding protein